MRPPGRTTRARTNAGAAWFGDQQGEGGSRRASGGGGEAGVVDERPGPVDQVLDDRGIAGDQAALGAERLRQRGRDDDVRLAGEPGLAHQADPARAGDAEPVGLVDDQQGAVRRAHAGQLGERRGVAEHGVDRLDDDHRAALSGAGQGSRDGGDVVVGHDGHVGAAEPDRVDQRGVHVCVGDDQALTVHERGHHRQVGGVAGRQHEGPGLSEEAGEVGLELGVQRQ